jgi:hypothetical protein
MPQFMVIAYDAHDEEAQARRAAVRTAISRTFNSFSSEGTSFSEAPPSTISVP